jgi:hypothetical protein
MFRVTALLLVAIAMQSAAIAQNAKQDTIQVRRQPSLAQVGPLPDCDQARGRNSVPWNSDMPAPATGLRITDPNKDPLTSHEYPAPSEKSYSFPWGWDQGHSWDALNAQLPVGPTSSDNSSKNITLSVTNNITMNGPIRSRMRRSSASTLTGRPTTYRGFSSARSSEAPNFWRFL